jgi:hypothetical protein
VGTHWIPTRYHGGENDMIFQNIMPIRLLATNTKKIALFFTVKSNSKKLQCSTISFSFLPLDICQMLRQKHNYYVDEWLVRL